MNAFLNSLEDKMTAMEQDMQTLPGELDSVVTCLDRGKLRSLFLNLNRDCDELLDKLFTPQRNSSLLFPFVIEMAPPLIRGVTNEDLTRWREAHKSDIWVVVGRGRMGVVAASEVAKGCNMTVSQVILVLNQQGYVVLGWDQYRKLLDEIDGLIGGDEEQDTITGSAPAIGVPLRTVHSTREVKVLPKSSSS